MSNVPMTRPEELLALHETPYFHSSTFTELDDGRILHAAGTTFTTSDDGGITWSEPFECRDTDGDPVGGSGTSLVRLAGRGVG
ncbi:MAG: sialidase family protein, partial [Chloroflexota bacterium]|nr:sialidase family protein [Chloroflexota bacterium]